MPTSYYKDITDSVPDSKKLSMHETINELNRNKQGKSKMIETLVNDKVMSLLKEAKYTDNIVSRVVAKLREGGVDIGKQRIYRVPVARINPPGTVNGNNRRYSRELWENVMNNQESAWKGLCGLADHPTDDNDPGSFKNSSIVWLGMELDVPNNLVYGIGSFVGPYGHLAQEIIDAGGRVGFSSSGFGELESDGVTVNPDTYQIERLADVVLNPSQSVYGVINDETNLGNIEYTKKTVVNESMSSQTNNKIQENANMADKESGVKSALSKVEEKELRKHINNYLKENVEITNPIKQLQDLKDIQSLIREGQLTDLESDVEQKLQEAQKRIEDMVEFGLKMKEAQVTVDAGAPSDTNITVKSDGGVDVNVGQTTAVVASPVVDTTAASETCNADASVSEDPVVDDPVASEDDKAPEDDNVDNPVEDVDSSEADDNELFESKLTKREEKAIREHVSDFLNKDHSTENPLEVIKETNEVLKLVREGKLTDMEETVNKKIDELRKQLKEDIDNAHKMKMDLKVASVNEVSESAKSIMKSGKLLVEQVSDYKELCEAITKRNQQIMNEYKALQAKLSLAEASSEDSRLERNKNIVTLSSQVKELKENYDKLDIQAGNKVMELNEALSKATRELENYKEGNSKLERANGLLKTQLRNARSNSFNVFEKENMELRSQLAEAKKFIASTKAKMTESKRLNENLVAGPISVSEFTDMKKENEALKAALATFKAKESQPVDLDMSKLDEASAREIKILRREVKSLKERLGENVDNYVKNMEGSVVSYYNDLEARYGESIKPYKKSFLNARSLREAQRMFLSVARELDNAGQLDESQTYVPAEGKVSNFYEGNNPSTADNTASAFGLL